MSTYQSPHRKPVDPAGRSGGDDEPSALAQRTWPQSRASTNLQRAAKVARVHTLTDPLGAKGFRETRQRVRSETGARRRVLLASMATFAASFGIIVATNHAPATANTATAPAATTATNGQPLTNSASSVGAAVNLFTGRATDGLAAPATVQSTPTQAPKATATATATASSQDDGNAAVATGGSNSSITSSANDSSSSSSQNATSDQSNQVPVFQHPSHTRSGGS